LEDLEKNEANRCNRAKELFTGRNRYWAFREGETLTMKQYESKFRDRFQRSIRAHRREYIDDESSDF